jgi:hypothetical protein
MKGFILGCAAIACFQLSAGQTLYSSGERGVVPAIPFFGSNFPVADGYNVDVSAGYPVFQDYAGPVSARVYLTLAGALQLGYTNDGYIDNPIGMTRPANSWDAKVLLLRQRDLLPSVALWVRGTFGWESENLTANDFLTRYWGDEYDRWYTWFHYEFNSTAVGLTMEEEFGENFAFNFSVGYHESESRDLSYTFAPYGLPSTYHAVFGNKSSLIDVSANVLLRLSPEVAAIAQAGTLPYFSTKDGQKLSLSNAYAGAFGVRYSPSIPVSVDGYVRWQSRINGQTYTQIRIGLSSNLHFD